MQAPMYYRNANCAVVVYDITQSVSLFHPQRLWHSHIDVFSQASLEKARSWIRELQRQADPSIIIALCGNKTDLAARRQVTQEEAKKYAEEEGLMWCEASAKTGEGVQDIFMAIGRLSRSSKSISVLTPLIAKKLPLSAPQSQKGAVRTPGTQRGVDLNKQPAAPEGCNC